MFVLPSFNLTVDVYTGPWVGRSYRISTPGNLAWGRRTQDFAQFDTTPDVLVASPQMVLLLPPFVDVRSKLLSNQGDILEIPSGSGRWYGVFAVDDIGKGFPNEHRAAWVLQISQYLNATDYAGCFWPIPMP